MGKYIHDSEKVNSEFDCRYVNLTTAKGLENLGKGGGGKLWAFGKKLWEIRRAIRVQQPDGVYITPNSTGGPFFKDFVVVQWCKWLTKGKVILHFHNKGVSTRQNRWIDNILYQQFFKITEVILLGRQLFEDVKKYVPEERVHFCANGIQICRGARYKVRGRESNSRILFLSNLLITKGVLELLDALTLLRTKGRNVVCDFVGGETAEIDAQRMRKEITERQLEGMAVYHGCKYGEEKEKFFEQADIFCFPTYYHNECFPLVLLEAMQHGLPCISTNEGAIPNIIDEGITGLIIEKRNTEQLAEKLELLLSNKNRRLKMGRAGKEKYEREFTLERFEQRFVEVLKDKLHDNRQ